MTKVREDGDGDRQRTRERVQNANLGQLTDIGHADAQHHCILLETLELVSYKSSTGVLRLSCSSALIANALTTLRLPILFLVRP